MDQSVAPLNYFLHAHGPAAQPTLILDWIYGGIAALVCIIIGVLLWIAIRRHQPTADYRVLKDGGSGGKWVFIGTIISVAVLFGMAIYAMAALNQVATPAEQPQLTIAVTGYDWWWKAEYKDADPSKDFVTANEIHIPTGVPVLIELRSMDVIHAFWVPQLAGKTQMIPGMLNRQWLQADEPGIYRGQCTQFCGVQHAHMAFEVVAQTPSDFAKWLTAQRLNAKPASGMDPTNGQQIFAQQCGACHAVRGSGFNGQHGPDLTHLMSRREIGAGMMVVDQSHVLDWIAHVQTIKPGARMPDFTLSEKDSSALWSYLSTLQ